MQQLSTIFTGAGRMLPAWALPTLLFCVALGVTLRASARFADLVEALGDHWDFSPGLLSFVSALGANIPNYAASIAAFASGQGPVGVGIIVGSNIYNLAVILGLVAFVTRHGHGIRLTEAATRDVQRVVWLAVAMGVTTWLAILCVVAPLSSASFTGSSLALPALERVLYALTLGLFVGFIAHAAQRTPHAHPMTPAPEASETPVVSEPPEVSEPREASGSPRRTLAPGALVARCLVALGLALAGVIVMVQAGLAAGADLHIPATLLSVVVLAVATSLPNTVVAVELARTGQAGASLEEIASSNGINLALGVALPALLWSGTVAAPFLPPSLIWMDLPLLTLLGVVVAGLAHRSHIARWAGVGLLGAYALWVVIHLVIA
jgi:cation:H+ antiporter